MTRLEKEYKNYLKTELNTFKLYKKNHNNYPEIDQEIESINEQLKICKNSKEMDIVCNQMNSLYIKFNIG
jgi:hypothetical protein